jgi:hypothetical protein
MRSTVSQQLRDELDRVSRIEEPSAAATRRMKRVNHPHSIEFVESGSTLGEALCNCFAFAFGLCDQLRGIQHQPESVFVAKLLADRYFQDVADAERRDGTIAIYLDAMGQPAHAGIVQVDTSVVVSKWGLTGHVWRHSVFEAPASYGDDARFFRPPEREAIFARFNAQIGRRV